MDVNEVLEIKTDEKRFFYEYLLLKKPVLEVVLQMINKKRIVLNPKMLHVFSLLLYYNKVYSVLNDETKWQNVFSKETRLEIMNEVEITSSHLNTYLSIMRNIHLLTDKTISAPFIIYPGSEYELTFKFILNGHDKQPHQADNK